LTLLLNATVLTVLKLSMPVDGSVTTCPYKLADQLRKTNSTHPDVSLSTAVFIELS